MWDANKKKKVNLSLLTGRRGPQVSETSRLPHFLDNRLRDGEVRLTRRPAFAPSEVQIYSTNVLFRSAPVVVLGVHLLRLNVYWQNNQQYILTYRILLLYDLGHIIQILRFWTLSIVLFLFKTQRFGDWIVSPSLGKTYSVGPNR
jgi:hypothetical protein